MSSPMGSGASDGPLRYAVRVAGHVDRRWSAWLDGFEIIPSEDETLIVGEVPDQAALYGLLSRLRDINLELLSLERI